jgi:phosphopantetheinyl transferase (holo-ACP synthase)
MSDELKQKEEYTADQPHINDAINVEKIQEAPKKPNLLFTTHILWDDRAKETIKHVSPPQFVGTDLIQFATSENIVVVNSKYVRRAVTSVEQLKEENGHSRIIV